MSKQSLFPVVITKQLNGAVYIKANGRHFGFTTLNYSFHGSDVTHSMGLETDEAVITDFPEGAGRYHIWLGSADGRQSVRTEFYYNRDSDVAVYKKILSYLYNPEDEAFVSGLIKKIRSTRVGYAHQIAKEFKKIKAPTDFESISFYQLVTMAERYENTMAVSFNRSYLSKLNIYYGADFCITPPPSFTSVDVYRYDGDTPVYCYSGKISGRQFVHFMFAPGQHYRMDFFCDTEQVLTLQHYELDEAGAAYLWEQDINTSENVDVEMMDDTELSHSGIDLTAEDKHRIVEERRHEPSSIIVGRPLVSASDLDPYILNVTIPDYAMLEASPIDYTLSIVEQDLYESGNFDHRIPITGQVVKVDAHQMMLDDEIILCVKDSDGNPVSKYARYQLSYKDDDYVAEYNEKRHLMELLEYTNQLLDGFKEYFGAGELYATFADIAMPLCKDYSKSKREVFDSIILAVARTQKLIHERDNILFYVEDNWMKQGIYDAEFFPEAPVFYYAEGRVTFPNNRTDYVICVERYDTFNSTVSREYISSAKSSGISVNVTSDDLCCIHAVDAKTCKSSGRIFFNNLGGHTYYRDQMDLEVIIYNG